jgi:hypothetical protein
MMQGMRRIVASALIGAMALSVLPATGRADEWGQYYYWGYHHERGRYWSPYEYEPLYEGRYRYPAHQRVYGVPFLWRSDYMKQFLWWKFPQHRRFHSGYHFVLDVL